MTRLERTTGRKRESIELLREGNELVVKTTFATPTLAERALEQMTAARLAKGWKRVRPPKARPARPTPGAPPTPEQEQIARKFLLDLDVAHRAGQFVYPLHDRMDYAGMRVHAYSGRAGFALVFEMLVSDREVRRIEQTLGFCNMAFIFYSEGRRASWNDRLLRLPVGRASDDDAAIPTSLLLRRKRLTLAKRPANLGSLLRQLVDTHRRELFASDIERAKVMRGMYKILTVDEWHYRFTEPSKLEAMQLLAKVLVTGDATHYRPRQKANTDWRRIRA